jgi:hypothetical protein
MKVIKTAVYRITASTGCACQVTQEYEDADYKKPTGKAEFSVCKKHAGKPGVEVIEMILSELVEKEATDHVAAPAANAPRPNAAAVVNEAGELEMRVPIKRMAGRVTSVKPSGTTATPAGRPVNAAQAGRTGPAKAYVRPTAPVKPANAAPNNGLAAALAEDEGPEDDLLAQNDPEKAY